MKKIIKHNKEVTKVERQPGESFQECVDRGVPKLIDEGMSPDQAVAAARSMCELKKDTKIEWGDLVLDTKKRKNQSSK